MNITITEVLFIKPFWTMKTQHEAKLGGNYDKSANFTMNVFQSNEFNNLTGRRRKERIC